MTQGKGALPGGYRTGFSIGPGAGVKPGGPEISHNWTHDRMFSWTGGVKLGFTFGASVPALRFRHYLPALMGSLRQLRGTGELVLEQNDGNRRLHWEDGRLTHLRSDAVGEQFGGYLIRRGVLDVQGLHALLSGGQGTPMGDRVVELGLMTREARDGHLRDLAAAVLLHALEHPILRASWIPAGPGPATPDAPPFQLDHRRLVWSAFQVANLDGVLADLNRREPGWRWQAGPGGVETVQDLPLTPSHAYALSLLGSEPLGCATLASITGIPPHAAARMVHALWAVGGLDLVEGDLPPLPRPDVPPVPEPIVPAPLEDALLEAPVLLAPGDVLLPDLEEISLDFGEGEAALGPASPGAPTPSGPIALPVTPARPLTTPLPPGVTEALDEALPAAERARRLLVKARSYQLQDRTSEAIRALEESVRLDGDSRHAAETWLLLGRIRTTNPAWANRAIEALQAAARLDPRAAEPWVLMGEVYRRKGFHANAEGCFRRALELDPSVAVPTGRTEPSFLAPQAVEPRTPQGFWGRLFGRDDG